MLTYVQRYSRLSQNKLFRRLAVLQQSFFGVDITFPLVGLSICKKSMASGFAVPPLSIRWRLEVEYPALFPRFWHLLRFCFTLFQTEQVSETSREGGFPKITLEMMNLMSWSIKTNICRRKNEWRSVISSVFCTKMYLIFGGVTG